MNRIFETMRKANFNKFAAIFVFLALLGVFAYTRLNPREDASLAPLADVVAVVQSVDRDVRQRPVEEAGWYRAEPQAEIQRGDAVYSGTQSRSVVQMKSGGILELGEETLVIFDDVDGVTVPDLSRGQVKLKINGSMKVAISGEVTEFTGAQSELVLNTGAGLRRVKVIRGETSIKSRGQTKRALKIGDSLELPKVAKSSKPARISFPAVDAVISQESLSSKRKIAKSMAADRTMAGSEPPSELPREARPEVAPKVLPESVPATVTEILPDAPIESAPEPITNTLEIAPTVSSAVVAKEVLSPIEPVLIVQRVMKVQELYQRKGSALLLPRTGLKFLKTPVTLAWNGAANDEKIYLQLSKDPEFKKPWLESNATGSKVVVDRWKAGKSYWRVSRDLQSWSAKAEVTVKPRLSASQSPTIAASKRKVTIVSAAKGHEAQANLRFQDSGVKKVRGWILQGSSSAQFPIEGSKTLFVSKSRIAVPLHRPGRYFFRVRSVASAGEISIYSPMIKVDAVIATPPPAVPIRIVKEPVEKQRTVAAVEKTPPKTSPEPSPLDDLDLPEGHSKTKVQARFEDDRNRVRPWQISIEGGESAFLSTVQIGTSVAPARVRMIGLRGGISDGKNSTFLGYRGQVAATNSEGSTQAASRLHGSYTRWWQMPWRPLRIGWLGGFDSYRNSSSGRFSKGYDLAKTGLDVGISFTDKWRGGGNILLGGWTDSNRAYEIGGFVTYDFSREFGFGLGYRLSFFDAGSTESAPIALPYREGLVELYSSLNFSF